MQEGAASALGHDPPGKEVRVLHDLAVLTPSLVVCAGFLAAVVMFLRRQMGPRRVNEEDGPANIPDDTRNTAHETAAGQSARRGSEH